MQHKFLRNTNEILGCNQNDQFRRPEHTSFEDLKSSVLIMIKIVNTLDSSFVIFLFSLPIMWVVNNLATFNKFTKHDALRKKRPYS